MVIAEGIHHIIFDDGCSIDCRLTTDWTPWRNICSSGDRNTANQVIEIFLGMIILLFHCHVAYHFFIQCNSMVLQHLWPHWHSLLHLHSLKHHQHNETQKSQVKLGHTCLVSAGSIGKYWKDIGNAEISVICHGWLSQFNSLTEQTSHSLVAISSYHWPK